MNTRQSKSICINSRTPKISLVWFCVFLITISTANAAVTIVVSEIGADVVATATGNADLADLAGPSSFNTTNGVVIGEAFGPNFISLLAIGGGGAADAYMVPTTTNDFTSGNRTLGSASSGGVAGVSEGTHVGPREAVLYVPKGYLTKSPISSSSTFSGQSFATMGLIPGTYVYGWGTANPDTLTLRIGPPRPVPTTSVYGLALTILGFGLIVIRRLRTKVKRI